MKLFVESGESQIRLSLFTWSFGAAILLYGANASGQTLISAITQQDPSGITIYNFSFLYRPQPFLAKPVSGAPYSAEEVSEASQVSADGTRSSESQTLRKLYRDSKGRRRIERSLYVGPQNPALPLIEITDFVAGYHYTLDLQNRIAYRSAAPKEDAPAADTQQPQEPPVATAAPDGSVKMYTPLRHAPQIQQDVPKEPAFATRPGSAAGPHVDHLGTQTIDGVVAEGTRYTNILPNGAATAETWMSTELKIVILSKTTNAGGEDHVIKLKSLSRTEPDPNLFQVPPGYTVRNEPGEFRMDFSVRK